METYRGIVYPAQCDANGHLNITGYIAFFDQAEWHTFLKLGFNAAEMRSQGIGIADVKHTVEYKSELLAGDLAHVVSRVRSVGTKSLTTFHELYNSGTGTLSATLEAVTVQFDLGARRAMPLTDTLRRNATASMDAISRT